MPHIPARPNIPAQRSSEDLEGTIGKLWLNRIGIVAILIGVAYFLKYAFDKAVAGSGRAAGCDWPYSGHCRSGME